MKKHTWKDVMKYFAEHEQIGELWDYVTSLRGPDYSSYSWKMVITCIIRGECKTAYGIDTAKSFLDSWENKDITQNLRSEDSKSDSTHWFSHSIYAVECLSKYYSNAMDNLVVADLFSKLAVALDEREIDERVNIVPIITRKIIEELYKDE